MLRYLRLRWWLCVNSRRREIVDTERWFRLDARADRMFERLTAEEIGAVRREVDLYGEWR